MQCPFESDQVESSFPREQFWICYIFYRVSAHFEQEKAFYQVWFPRVLPCSNWWRSRSCPPFLPCGDLLSEVLLESDICCRVQHLINRSITYPVSMKVFLTYYLHAFSNPPIFVLFCLNFPFPNKNSRQPRLWLKIPWKKALYIHWKVECENRKAYRLSCRLFSRSRTNSLRLWNLSWALRDWCNWTVREKLSEKFPRYYLIYPLNL